MAFRTTIIGRAAVLGSLLAVALPVTSAEAALGGALTGSDVVMAYLAPLVAGYLLGSIPFGLILTRFAGVGDIRNIGSGNIGATNVLRTGHKGLAALTLLLDALKGTAAVFLGYSLGAKAGLAIDGSLIAGLAAFLGHIFPVWLGFRGGKGVATYIGGLWLATALITRYSSASALAASVATPIALFALGDIPEALLAAVMSGLLLWKHEANIRRLLAGEEPKIGAKA
jgi:acyl phosphate:glycerol-3-phosphate acyltransferase